MSKIRVYTSNSKLVNDNGLIFMHDTAPNGINNKQPEWCGVNKTIEYIKENYKGKYEVLNFTKSNNFNPGAGFAIIKKNGNLYQIKLWEEYPLESIK